jgi:hypothetical protein
VGLALGIFGNVLALFVIVKTANLHKWKVFYKMITTLAVIGLTGILTTSPIVLSVYINKLQWVGGQPMCDFISFMLIFSGLTTCLIISVMAIDRYIAISHPIKYRILPKGPIELSRKFGKHQVPGWWITLWPSPNKGRNETKAEESNNPAITNLTQSFCPFILTNYSGLEDNLCVTLFRSCKYLVVSPRA